MHYNVSTIIKFYICQGELIVAVRDDLLASHRKRRISEGRVISKKSGQVCAEFKCNWAL